LATQDHTQKKTERERERERELAGWLGGWLWPVSRDNWVAAQLLVSSRF
jgi:hypothetical protein